MNPILLIVCIWFVIFLRTHWYIVIYNSFGALSSFKWNFLFKFLPNDRLYWEIHSSLEFWFYILISQMGLMGVFVGLIRLRVKRIFILYGLSTSRVLHSFLINLSQLEFKNTPLYLTLINMEFLFGHRKRNIILRGKFILVY